MTAAPRPPRRLAIAILVAPMCGRSAPAQDAAAWADDLARVQAVLAGGEARRALGLLDDVLERHRETDHARAARVQLEEIVQRAKFAAEHPPPTPDDVVEGKLLRYDRRTGRMRVRYGGDMGDLLGAWQLPPEDRPADARPPLPRFAAPGTAANLHAAVFRGPHSLSIAGRTYPSGSGANAHGYLRVLVCLDGDDGYDVVFGSPEASGFRSVSWVPLSIGKITRGVREEIAEKTASPARPGKPFRVQVQVENDRIKAYYDGRLVMQAPKPADAFGHLGYQEVGGRAQPTQVVIDGLANTAWIDGRIDAIQSARRSKFRDGFRAREHLPAWLYQTVAAAPAADQGADVVAAVLEALARGDLDAARRSVAAAPADHPHGEALRRMLHMIEAGPEWSRRYDATSRHFEVASDLDLATCREATTILEESLRAYQADLGWLDAEQQASRFRVYLFAGNAGYEDYCRAILGAAPPHTAGLYSPTLKQLLIWNLPDRDDMWRTVRHEALHQYLDLAAPHAPIWLNEGLAEYYEAGGFAAGRYRGGELQPAHLRTLRAKGMAPLPKLLRLDHRGFYARPDVHYAQSWALVRFLLHGEARHRALFDAARTASPDGDPFAGVDLAALEAEFQAAVATWPRD